MFASNVMLAYLLRITSLLITIVAVKVNLFVIDIYSASETSGATTSTQNFLTLGFFGVILMCYLFCVI